MRSSRQALAAMAALLALVAAGCVSTARAADPPVDPGPTPRAQCGPGSDPETGTQGRVSAAEIASGRAARGYTCNTELVSHFGPTGGYKVHRYVDPAGHECAYYDTTLLFPGNAPAAGQNFTGVFVLDMSDPAHPVRTETLQTPAMQSPHESLSINTLRGLLVADMGYPTFNPGFVDVYDLTQDCRHPVLKSSTPMGILGHEGNISPDGRTFWSSSAAGHTLTAVDLTNPSLPVALFTTTDFEVHGLNIGDDGNRMYFADLGSPDGMTILDISQVQQRVVNPQVTVVSTLTWDAVSIPQVPIPVTINGHRYLVEVDEFARISGVYNPNAPVGAARIIDIADETNPKVVSNIRLQVHQPENRAGEQAGDPGATSGLQGYAGHYCAVPQRAEPGIVACSMILSGLRLFDIRDPLRPKEIGYFNPPGKAGFTNNGAPTDYAMSGATFVPSRGEIWYSDGNSGFYALRVTNGVWPFAQGTTPALTERFFADGTTLDRFREYLLLFNPTPTPAEVAVTYYFDDGATPRPTTVRVPARSRATIDVVTVDGVGPGRTGVSIGVSSMVPVVAERSVYFDRENIGSVDGVNGSHSVLGAEAPRRSWTFAEGSTQPGFQEYITLQNPGTSPANVTVAYGIEGGGTGSTAVTVPAGQRRTVDVNAAIPGTVGHSTQVTSDAPVLAERPMYFRRVVSDDGVEINGGHVAFGSNPGYIWNFAEGNVLPDFAQYLTLANPDTANPASATITYFLSDGTSQVKNATVAAGSRRTVRVFDRGDPAGVGRDVSDPVSRGVSIQVSTSAGGGMVVERPMYFHRVIQSGGPEINDGHDTPGAAGLAKVWSFAEGSTLPGFYPFLTVLNPASTPASIEITYTPDNGPPVMRTVTAGPTSRLTVQVYGEPSQGGIGAQVTGFGIVVASPQPVLVERPFYVDRVLPGLPMVVNGGSVVIGAPG